MVFQLTAGCANQLHHISAELLKLLSIMLFVIHRCTYPHTHTHSPLAVAIFDYEAFDEIEDNLEFEEGDLIEVSEGNSLMLANTQCLELS